MPLRSLFDEFDATFIVSSALIQFILGKMTNEYYSSTRLRELLIDNLRLAFATICLVLILGAIAALLSYQQNCSNCPNRVIYEGRVVNKFLTFAESLEGSILERRLLIRSTEGAEFEVFVNQPIYEKAQIGIWIESDEKGVRFSP